MNSPIELSASAFRFVSPSLTPAQQNNPPCDGLKAICEVVRVTVPLHAEIVAVEAFARDHLASAWTQYGADQGPAYAQFEGAYQVDQSFAYQEVRWTFKNWATGIARNAKVTVRYVASPVVPDIKSRMAEPLGAYLSSVDTDFAAALPKRLKNVDDGFLFATQSNDVVFRPTDVEPLLEQACSLLDRAVQDRAAWMELGVRWFQTSLELKSLRETIKIHTDEIQAGFYDQDQLRCFVGVSGERANSEALEDISILIQATRQLFGGNAQGSRPELAGGIAKASASPLTKAEFALPTESYQINGYTGTKPDVLEKLSTTLEQQDWNIRIALNSAQSILQRGNAEASYHRLAGQAAALEWESRNVGFKLRRDDLERSLWQLRADAFATEGGFLNFSEKMDAIQKRILGDLRNAYARIDFLLSPYRDRIAAKGFLQLALSGLCYRLNPRLDTNKSSGLPPGCTSHQRRQDRFG